MRILHVVPSYFPAVRYGGPIRSVHALAAAVGRRGHEVHVYTTNVDGPNNSDVPLGQPVDRGGVCVWYYPTDSGRRLYRSPAMGRALHLNLSKFDIVHVHSVFLWPTLAARREARRSGVPYIVAPRGMLVRDLIRKKSWLAKRAWIELFERRNINQAAAIHVTSEIESNELSKLGFKPRRVAVVPNGIELPPKTVIRVSSHIVQGSTPARPFVLFLGRVNWEKGLDRLIPAIALVPGVELVIAGNDEENYQPTLLALVEKLGVGQRVRFLGPVDSIEKWALLQKAHMLVLPSYSESFGNVILEAMSVGCPVVVTPEVGLASTVRTTNAGLVVEGVPEKLATAINGLMQDREACRRMGEAGQKTAREQFSWEAVALQMEHVYEQCVGKGSSRA